MDDPLSLVLKLGVILALLMLNAFCVAAEFALVKVRGTQLQERIEQGSTQARYAKKLTDRIDVALSVTQLGITIASLGLGWLGEPTVSRILGPVFAAVMVPEPLASTLSFAVSFVLLLAAQVVLAELVPKNIAIQASERILLAVALPLILFEKPMYPFVWLLNHVANWVTLRLGYEIVSEGEAAHTEDEIRILMEESHKKGYIDKTELDFVDNVFDFADLRVREVMIPRTDMICLYIDAPMEENMKTALEKHMTRYPVCIEDKDHIVGFLHIKDLLRTIYKGERRPLRTLVRKSLFVPETMAVSRLLKTMQKSRSQFAIVVDEYGGTSGMVTIEDLVEEIVGDIRDEFDEGRPMVEQRGPRLYSVDGRMLLSELEDILEIKIDDMDVDTLGGWLYDQVDAHARIGQKASYGGVSFFVEEVHKARITRVLVGLDRDLEEEHDEIAAL